MSFSNLKTLTCLMHVEFQLKPRFYQLFERNCRVLLSKIDHPPQSKEQPCTRFCKFLVLCISLDIKTLDKCIALIIYISICRTEPPFDPTALLKIGSTTARKQMESMLFQIYPLNKKISAWKWAEYCLIRQTGPGVTSSESFRGYWIWLGDVITCFCLWLLLEGEHQMRCTAPASAKFLI